MVACLPALTVYLTYRAWSHRLPDPLPTHWGLRGQVDGTTAVAGFLTVVLTVVLAMAAAGGLLAVAGALVTRLRWRARRMLVCVGASVAGFAAGLWLVIAGLSLDHTDASQVPTPTWHIPVLLLATVGWGWLAFTACGSAPPHPAAVGRPGSHLPRVDVPRASVPPGARSPTRTGGRWVWSRGWRWRRSSWAPSSTRGRPARWRWPGGHHPRWARRPADPLRLPGLRDHYHPRP